MSRLVGWHRQRLSRLETPCAKCGAKVLNDPDCVPMLCATCLRLFHAGTVRHAVNRSDTFAVQAVALDHFLGADSVAWAYGPELTDDERAAHAERVWTERHRRVR